MHVPCLGILTAIPTLARLVLRKLCVRQGSRLRGQGSAWGQTCHSYSVTCARAYSDMPSLQNAAQAPCSRFYLEWFSFPSGTGL